MLRRTVYGFVFYMTATSASASQVADYQFQNSYSSSVSGAPILSPIGTDSFVTDSVYGSSEMVLSYSAHSGLALAPTTGILPDGASYTIFIRSRHVQNMGYIKMIDFADATNDAGLYDDAGRLNFYDLGASPDTNIGSGYTDIALTRATDGTLSGYLNGILQFTTDDSVSMEGVIDSTNELIFFVDDNVTGGQEVSPGAVARIEIWNEPLDATTIGAMSSDQIFGDGFEIDLSQD